MGGRKGGGLCTRGNTVVVKLLAGCSFASVFWDLRMVIHKARIM